VVFSLALIIGPTVGSFIAATWGATAMFAFSCAAGLVAIPLLWLAIGRPVPAADVVSEA
jgi:predicted MFS family arabinose efflux permease